VFAEITGSSAFRAYRLVLVPFAGAVLLGIVYLLIRRVVVRPVGLGTAVSLESVLIALFIVTLMVTFLLGFRLDDTTLAGRVNWWAHMIVILGFLALIPASKHFHLLLSPITVFLKSAELGRVENLDFEKEQVGLETLKDLGKKTVLDAFTCVECGRCQVNCPAWGAGKELNPKALILQTQDALVSGERDRKLGEIYSEKVLWQCTTLDPRGRPVSEVWPAFNGAAARTLTYTYGAFGTPLALAPVRSGIERTRPSKKSGREAWERRMGGLLGPARVITKR